MRRGLLFLSTTLLLIFLFLAPQVGALLDQFNHLLELVPFRGIVTVHAVYCEGLSRIEHFIHEKVLEIREASFLGRAKRFHNIEAVVFHCDLPIHLRVGGVEDGQKDVDEDEDRETNVHEEEGGRPVRINATHVFVDPVKNGRRATPQ